MAGKWSGVLLTRANPKTRKGESRGYLTGVLHFLPASSSRLRTTAGKAVNVCPYATGCAKECLAFQGRGPFAVVRRARKERLRLFLANRREFVRRFLAETDALVASAKRRGMVPVVRVNGTSDLPGLAAELAGLRPAVQFYDYTKVPGPWKRQRSNYHLTFSRSERNEADCLQALEAGVNVAVVFRVRRGKALPATYLGKPVIDGDLHDLRFLDRSGVVVGLRAKGRSFYDKSGFVVDVGVE